MTLETELRDRLHGAAWRAGAGGDDLTAADAVIDLRRAQRRHRAVTAVVVCAVAVLVALVPVLTEYRPNRAAPATTTRSAPHWTEPTRGSLAHDRAFLDAIRARDLPGGWQGAMPATTRVVAFAGDAEGSRFALVVGVSNGRLVGLWFTGRAGAPARLLDPDTSVTIVRPQDASLSALRTDASGTTVVVLTRPGDRAEVSWHATVDADGQVRRSWQPMTVTGGAAVAHLADGSISASVRYRVLRGGQTVNGGFLGGQIVPPDGLDAATDQQPRRPSDGTASRRAVSLAVQQVALPTGVSLIDLRPVLLWTGTAPMAGGQSTRAVVVAFTVPSGAVVVGTAFGSDDPALAEGTCGSSGHPAGSPLDGLVVVAACDLPNDLGVQHSFVVSAPTGYDRVRFESSTGKVLADQPLARGAAVLPDPGTVATAVVSGPGKPDLRITPTSRSHDIFAGD